MEVKTYTQETGWLIYGLDVALLEKNMRLASKVQNALRKASERTTPLQRVLWYPVTTSFDLELKDSIYTSFNHCLR